MKYWKIHLDGERMPVHFLVLGSEFSAQELAEQIADTSSLAGRFYRIERSTPDELRLFFDTERIIPSQCIRHIELIQHGGIRLV